ncbi:MAG: hypothetical protein KatS3mg010_0340 [Acidimicrobiia bacterium]|nr:MAG: hypothetical protein KatS3mg010_0340 [Acidimicrobiia bacterium]
MRGPRGSGCVANVAAASNASSTVAARVIPAWRHMPSNTRSSLASDPVWLAAARCPPGVVPPFTSTTGLRRVTAREPLEQRAPVRDAFDVGEAHRGRVVGAYQSR